LLHNKGCWIALLEAYRNHGATIGADSSRVKENPPPGAGELYILRQEVDKDQLYI
jgi:hypothetical protein